MRKLILLSLFLLVGCATQPPSPLSVEPPPVKSDMVAWKWYHAAIMTHPMHTYLSSLKEVNDYVNKFAYQTDKTVYGVDDHWATPQEFLSHKGGDCEDFAIMKYYLVKENGLGQPRFMLVTDTKSNTAHAVLQVGSKILDQQMKNIFDVSSTQMKRYKFLRYVP